MIMRKVSFAFVLAAAAWSTTGAQAQPLFYLSDQNTDGAAPGDLDLTLDSGATGTFYIWGKSDVQLSGVSLNVSETGGAIQFTGFESYNPDSRWVFVDGPPVVENSIVKSIGGGAIPGLSGKGIGAGSTEPALGDSGWLLAAVNYTAVADGQSELFLEVGNNKIADWAGVKGPVFFGAEGNGTVDGNVAGAKTSVANGLITVGTTGGNNPPVAGNVVVDAILAGEDATGQFGATDPDAGDTLTWSGLTFAGYTPDFGGAGPSDPDTTGALLNDDGSFSWNTLGQARGVYAFSATASDGTDTVTDLLTVNVTAVPEPATFALCGLALVGMVGLVRRRG